MLCQQRLAENLEQVLGRLYLVGRVLVCEHEVPVGELVPIQLALPPGLRPRLRGVVLSGLVLGAEQGRVAKDPAGAHHAVAPCHSQALPHLCQRVDVPIGYYRDVQRGLHRRDLRPVSARFGVLAPALIDGAAVHCQEADACCLQPQRQVDGLGGRIEDAHLHRDGDG